MTPTTTDLKRKTGDGIKAAASGPLSAEELRKMHAYWRAANYLSVGQIYLMGNPLLKEPLQLKHVKPRLRAPWRNSSSGSASDCCPPASSTSSWRWTWRGSGPARPPQTRQRPGSGWPCGYGNPPQDRCIPAP
jgi:hypothetical protein